MKCLQLKYLPLIVIELAILAVYQMYLKYPLYKMRALLCGNGFANTHAMIYVGFACLMTFPRRYSFSALGYSLMLAATASLLASLLLYYNSLADLGKMIPNIEFLLRSDMVAATVLVTYGALLGVASDLQLLFITIVETFVACVNIYIMINFFRVADIGGSIAIHTFGAYFGQGVSLALMKKRSEPDNSQESLNLSGPSYISNITSLLGSLLLWVYWPSFNSGLAKSESECERALTNTYFALAASTVTTFFLSVSFSTEGKLSMVHIRSSTLAGGVAIGSVCNMYLQSGTAIAIGIIAAFISVLGQIYLTPRLEKIGIMDTCGVHNLHGMPGVFSGLLSMFFAILASKDTYGETDMNTIFPAVGPEKYKRTNAIQALYQFYALATTLVMALGCGIITGFVSKIPCLKPLKPTEKYDDEQNWVLP